MKQEMGASASRPGSRESSPDGLGPSGFDPSRLKWHIGDNLRWLADQPDRPPYMPCGILTGAFLRMVADKLELEACDSDGSPKGGDAVGGSVACDDSAGRKASPKTQSDTPHG